MVATSAGPREVVRTPRGAVMAALACTLALAVSGGRYGFHRDELYFVEAGHHPAWGYPDQPPLVPLLATAWHSVVGGSLWGFRLVPAVLAGLTVLVAAATSRALGGTAREQVATAVVVAVSPLVLATGHLFSTTTVDILLTAATVWLLVRALEDGGTAWHRWLLVGLVAGVSLQVKTLPATVLAACGVALLLVGPRWVVRRPGAWLAAGVAAALAAPNLWWQDANGWPQLELARAIAEGSSGTSVERWLVIPLQATLVGPLLVPLLVVAVVRGLRSPHVRPHRWIAVAYLVLLTVVTLTGGKPYYTAGLLPALVALAVPAVLGWLDRRAWGLTAAVATLVVHTALTAVITLPVLPVTVLGATPVLDINYDAGETAGWEAFVDTVSGAVAALPDGDRASAVVVTGNYGEAGALDRARRSGTGLPPVYSGHNAYGLWGPPPDGAAPVVVVGWYPEDLLEEWFTGCEQVASVDNGVDLDNEEQGVAVRVCTGPRRPWPALWPELTRLG